MSYTPAQATAKTVISIGHVEITQGLQIHDNSLPLVLGKPTVIRVFPVTAADAPSVYVTATVQVAHTFTTWSKPIWPDNGPILAAKEFWRGDADASLNLTLEPDWYSADGSGLATDAVERTFLVALHSAGSGGKGNTLTTQQIPLRFERRRELRVHYVVVEFSPQPGQPVPPRNRVASQEAAGFLRGVYPAAPTLLQYDPAPMSKLPFDKVDSNGKLDGSELILQLNNIFIGDPDTDRLYAWTAENTFPPNGRSDPLYLGGKGTVAFGNDTGEEDKGTGAPYKPEKTWRWRRTFAHELGHNTDKDGLDHPSANPDSVGYYPPQLQDDQFGYDALSIDVVQPSRRVMRSFNGNGDRLYDFMVGGRLEYEAWIGRTNFLRLFNWMAPLAVPSAGFLPPPDINPLIRLVHGIVGCHGKGELKPFFYVPLSKAVAGIAKTTPYGDGPAEVRFYDGNDDEMLELRIGWTPVFVDAEGNPLETAAFTWLLPLDEEVDAQVQTVRLLVAGHIVHEVQRGEPLTIGDVVFEEIGDPSDPDSTPRLKVSWTVNGQLDPSAVDGSTPIAYQIHYSHDNETWRIVAMGPVSGESSAEIETMHLPRGQDEMGIFRIQVSHGYEISRVEEEVPLGPPPPVAVIVAPRDEQEYEAGAAILMMGYALKGGVRLPAEALTWVLENDERTILEQDGEMIVARPDQLQIDGNMLLQPGQYRLHLSAEGAEPTTIVIRIKEFQEAAHESSQTAK